MLLKPSLRAAASTFARVGGYLLLLLAAPVIVALVAQESAAAAGFVVAELGLAAVGPAIVGLLLPAVRLAFTRYELDGDGVRVHSSVIARSDQRVPWGKVTGIVQRRSLADRVLGISAVDVVAYGERGTTLRLVGLRDATPVRQMAAHAMRRSASVDALFDND